ncbi:hotdog domain-containing protein, partial [Streptomyces avermitilis]|uniref:hotdog domain-containing protein n=1 Tax=Streptomyces avermitilis TaxID=33903 RepID=UPI0037205536
QPPTFYGPGWSVATPTRHSEKPPASAGGGVTTTVQQSTSFQRAVTEADVLVEAVLTRLGRRMAFADITMTAEGRAEIAARASTVYALLD